MKKFNYKLRWKIMNIFIVLGLLWWFSETSYFIGKYGWHLKAINYNEKICDYIATALLWIAFWAFMSIMVHIASLFVKNNVTTLNNPENI